MAPQSTAGMPEQRVASTRADDLRLAVANVRK
jgi:hypothetical protein